MIKHVTMQVSNIFIIIIEFNKWNAIADVIIILRNDYYDDNDDDG